MMLDKYIDNLVSSGSKFILTRTYANSISISPDMSEVTKHNNSILEKKDTSGLTELVVQSYRQKFCPNLMEYEVSRHQVLVAAIQQIIGSIKEHNKRNSGLSNPRMGGVHKFLKKIDSNEVANNSQNKKVKEFIDAITLIFMMINTGADKSETMDMITCLKNQYDKVINEL